MTPVYQTMLRRFMTLYGEPRTNDPAIFIGEYEKALAGTRQDVLEAATDALIRGNERRSWPTIGECVKAVHAAAERIEFASRHKPSEGAKVMQRVSRNAGYSQETLDRWEKARVWREQVCAQYGSMDTYLSKVHPPGSIFQNDEKHGRGAGRSSARPVAGVAAGVLSDVSRKQELARGEAAYVDS